MASTPVLLCLFIAVATLLEHVHTQDTKSHLPGKRGTNSKYRFSVFHPELPLITPKPPNTGPQIRRGRGESFLDKIQINGGMLPRTVPTTTTTTTTTKSPEQIEKEKEIQMKKQDPKGFSRKLIEILNVEEETKEMDKELHKMLDSCSTNSDCVNATCCFKEDPSKPGECIIKPHKVDQRCTDLCGCVGKNLECKQMKIDAEATADKDTPIQQTKQCKTKKIEFLKDIFKRFKSGKGSPKGGSPVKRTRRVGTHNRVIFA